MGKRVGPRIDSRLLIGGFVLGALLGASLAVRLDEESSSRIRKALFELGELPFRIFI